MWASPSKAAGVQTVARPSRSGLFLTPERDALATPGLDYFSTPERDVLRATAALSSAEADASDLLHLRTQGSRAFALGPELNLPVFSGSAADTRIASAKARHAEAAVNWR